MWTPLAALNTWIRCRRYFYRSQTDYGVVENSAEAAADDEAVLEAELDLNKLGGESESGSKQDCQH